jgi:hypothetical protein
MFGRVGGRTVEGQTDVTVLEMSLGGMAVETVLELPVGARHDFQLTLGDGAVVPLVGRVRHCRNVAEPGAEPRFVSGIEFSDEDPESGHPPVEDIIRRVT